MKKNFGLGPYDVRTGQGEVLTFWRLQTSIADSSCVIRRVYLFLYLRNLVTISSHSSFSRVLYLGSSIGQIKR
jgi:hypothetical protein